MCSIVDKEASDKLAAEAAVKKLSEIATDAKSREGDLLKNARQVTATLLPHCTPPRRCHTAPP